MDEAGRLHVRTGHSPARSALPLPPPHSARLQRVPGRARTDAPLRYTRLRRPACRYPSHAQMFLAPIRGDTGRRKEAELKNCIDGWTEFADVRAAPPPPGPRISLSQPAAPSCPSRSVVLCASHNRR